MKENTNPHSSKTSHRHVTRSLAVVLEAHNNNCGAAVSVGYCDRHRNTARDRSLIFICRTTLFQLQLWPGEEPLLPEEEDPRANRRHRGWSVRCGCPAEWRPPGASWEAVLPTATVPAVPAVPAVPTLISNHSSATFETLNKYHRRSWLRTDRTWWHHCYTVIVITLNLFESWILGRNLLRIINKFASEHCDIDDIELFKTYNKADRVWSRQLACEIFNIIGWDFMSLL